MSSEKPSVYKTHKREGNPKRSGITRCFSHSNIKLQRISCLNWLHKRNNWQATSPHAETRLYLMPKYQQAGRKSVKTDQGEAEKREPFTGA